MKSIPWRIASVLLLGGLTACTPTTSEPVQHLTEIQRKDILKDASVLTLQQLDKAIDNINEKIKVWKERSLLHQTQADEIMSRDFLGYRDDMHMKAHCDAMVQELTEELSILETERETRRLPDEES
jgi:hypothetical protein